MKNTNFIFLFACIFFYTSCGTVNPKRLDSKFNYFLKGLDSNQLINLKPLQIKPFDQLSIQVSSNTMNQDQVAIFNIINSGTMSTGSTGGSSSNNQQLSSSTMGYIVNADGFINFPMLGSLNVSGKTRSDLADTIAKILSNNNYVKNPVVQVRFLQLKVNVLGEVKMPGSKNFSSDRITILDAIGAAGDLTDRARRDNIKVIREDNGYQKVININLLDANFIRTEGFQLRQNDIIYVYANDYKLEEMKFNPIVTHDLQVGLGFASFLSLLLTIFVLIKK